MTAFVFDADQLAAAAKAFVEQGPSETRALGQSEVDGALHFLGSDAARKLRVASSKLGGGLSPEGSYSKREEQIG